MASLRARLLPGDEMAVDIGIEINNEITYYVNFGDDGYYWFLYPLFEELSKRTGIYIDLYGDAEFTKGNINQFETLLDKATQMVENQPASWAVHIGTQTHPVEKKLYSQVVKKEFYNKINKLRELILEVKNDSATLICTGD